MKLIRGGVYEDVWIRMGEYLDVWVGAGEGVSFVVPIFVW